MTRLFAFLRGVNLGKRTIRMDELRQSFERAGFDNVRTLIASGNVAFDGDNTPETVKRIEAQLQADFGFPVETILRSLDELKALAESDPFAGYEAGKDVKFYVFFLGAPEAQKLEMPCAAEGDFKVLGAEGREIFAVAFRMPNGRFGPGLDRIGKPFGRYVTSRNWNTVLRLIEMGEKPG